MISIISKEVFGLGILAVNVSLLRKRTGMTAKQLAERLKVGETTVYNIETGYISAPSDKLLENIAAVFDTTVDGLLGKTHLDIAERARMVYIVDSIDAKRPFVEVEKIIGSVFIDRDKLRGYDYIGLKIKDNSMANKRVLAGDIVIVRMNCPIKNNDIVVAATEYDSNAVVRMYCKSNNKIILKAANDSGLYSDITLNSEKDSFNLIGKVVKCEFDL